jgi:adenylate cyclase
LDIINMARFLITDPNGQAQIFEISGTTVNIGRADSNDLALNHPSVSRHHARLTVLPGDTTLLNDLGSLNGTYVNGQQIHEHRLNDQDRVNIGMYELKYDVAGPEAVHVEAGSQATDVSRLVSPESLSTALRARVEAGVPPAQAMQERLHSLEKENNLLKLLLYKDEKLKTDPRGVVLSKTLIERVTTERLPLLIHDVVGDERFSASESLRLSGIRSAMCAPLIYKDKVFGLFYVDCLTKPYAFSKEELSIFSVVAAEAAISFDNARSHEELSRRVIERKALERFLSSAIVEKILASPDQIHLGGENQTATILFSDIRGFTRMAEKMEPQKVVEWLNEYFTEMTDLIFENGGTLDKYLGDGIMAVFGAPIARHDDTARSVKTAMEMQRSLVRLNTDWEARGQPTMQIGIGVNTGPVTAGNIGSTKRMDYTVIGDAVNLASRLCANAAEGQILVSEFTFLQLKDGLPARKLDPIRVKGRETPVEIYEIEWSDSSSLSSAAPVSS